MKTTVKNLTGFTGIPGLFSILIILFLLSKNCPAQPAPPLSSVKPLPGRTNTAARRVITNVVLTWDAYTNAWFEVMGCTNLANSHWYHITNVPLTHTSQVIPVTQRQEFFRVCTRCNSFITTNH